MLKCPICGCANSPSQPRCVRCGADFHDLDIRELMQSGGSLGGGLLDGVVTMSASHVMGVSREGLDAGSALRRLAVIGMVLAIAGFLIPVASDFHHYAFPWAIPQGSIALFFPLVAIVIGVAVAVLPLPGWVGGAVLACTGTIGLLSSPSLGAFAATGTRGLPLLTLALVVGSAATIERLFTPRSRLARRALLGAGALALVGMMLPVGEPHDVLCAEMLFFHEHLEDSRVPLILLRSGAASGGHLTFFIGYFALAPLALLPAAAVAAQIAPSVWDRGAVTLRPMAWLLVLYFPLTMALGIFNLMGWDQVSWVSYGEHLVAAKDFTQAAMTGRSKLLLLDTTYALWAAFGLVALYRGRAKPVDEDEDEAEDDFTSTRNVADDYDDDDYAD